MDTLVDRTGQGNGFKQAAFRVIGREWNSDVHWEADDATGHVFTHVFFHANRHAGDEEILLFGLDANHRCHACRESRSDEVGG